MTRPECYQSLRSPAQSSASNISSIARRVLNALMPVSIATSSQLKAWPWATGRSSLTPCARPSGNPPIATERLAGSSFPRRCARPRRPTLRPAPDRAWRWRPRRDLAQTLDSARMTACQPHKHIGVNQHLRRAQAGLAVPSSLNRDARSLRM